MKSHGDPGGGGLTRRENILCWYGKCSECRKRPAEGRAVFLLYQSGFRLLLLSKFLHFSSFYPSEGNFFHFFSAIIRSAPHPRAHSSLITVWSTHQVLLRPETEQNLLRAYIARICYVSLLANKEEIGIMNIRNICLFFGRFDRYAR